MTGGPPTGGPPAARRRAAALRYARGVDPAPRVVASGHGQIAERIVALARAHGIPVHDDPALAAALVQVPLDRTIPAELFVAVAEILGFLFRLEEQCRRR